MKIQVEVQEDKVDFFLELMKNLKCVKSIKPIKQGSGNETKEK